MSDKKELNVLSLFDGMSCGQIALDKLGIKVDKYFASEIDKHAIKVTQSNYPNTKHIGSVTDVKGTNLPKIDLLIGGSPCQGFSFAGKQLNFDDDRSKLFFEFVRLLKEVNPKYFLLENVRMKKEYQDIISEYLGCEPVSINSRLVTYNQRKRLYWTNIPNIEQPKDLNLNINDFIGSDSYGTIKVLKDKSRIVIESKDIHSLTARYTDLNGSSRPMIILNRNAIGKPFDSKKTNINYRMLTPEECEKLQTVPLGYTKNASDSQRRKMLGNGWTVDVISHIFKNIQP